MVTIDRLSFKYPGTKHNIFEQFSLELHPNKIYGLLGKNGTGKSTLLYLISGLLRPKAGKVSFDGAETILRKPETLREIFIVPEEFELPAVSLANFVKLNRPFYPRFSEEVLNNCLHDFELTPDLDLGKLSMGQKKKVYLSFALAANTKLLLMDEPTNGLDIPSKSQFRKVIAQHMTDDRTLIISTHQVKDIDALLDHVVIIEGTQLLLDASVSDICEHYYFEFRSSGNLDDALYAEPTLQGNAVIARNIDGRETPINLELLFNAATNGKL